MLIGIDASRAVLAQRTGTENYSYQLIRRLLTLDTTHRYRLYFNAPPEAGLFPAVPHAEQRIVPFPRLWTHARLSWEMWRDPPDVLFVPAHVLPLIHPRHSVVTVHDLGYLYYPEAHTPLSRLYLDVSTRYNARAASYVIADSEATRQDLIRHYGAEAGKITVVYPGCSEEFRPICDAEALHKTRERYRLPDSYILHVGTLHPRKNLVRLVEAYALLRQSALAKSTLPDLVIAGKKGWLYNHIFQRVEELDITTHVHFPGYVSQEDLPALLSGAQLLVMPSLYEGFGLPVLEAMACGTPVVCSNTSSLPEVAGDAALLAEPLDTEGIAEAMGRLLRDTALRDGLIQRGFHQASRFTWEDCARGALEILMAKH